jgi:hypothetical protein
MTPYRRAQTPRKSGSGKRARGLVRAIRKLPRHGISLVQAWVVRWFLVRQLPEWDATLVHLINVMRFVVHHVLDLEVDVVMGKIGMPA